jgi:hypothetical protein
LPGEANSEAFELIGAPYSVEEKSRARPPDERRVYRQTQARPLLDQLHTWLGEMLATLSRKSDTSILYALNRWERSRAIAMTVESRSTICLSNVPYAVSPSGARPICLPARILDANVLQFTARSARPNSTELIPKCICVTFSFTSQSIGLAALMDCYLGIWISCRTRAV